MSGRSWLRLSLIGLAVLFLLGVGVSFGLRLKWRTDLERAVEQYQREVGPLDPSSVAPPKLEPSENAASWLVAAATALLVDDEMSTTLGLARQPRVDWTDEQRVAVRSLLDAHSEVLTLAARATPLARSSFGARYTPVPLSGDELGIVQRPLAPDPVVDLLAQLRLSRFLRLSVVTALEQGDCVLAVERLEIAVRQVRALLAERMVIFGLIGSAVSGVLMEDVADLIAVCGAGDEASLQSALAAIERFDREAKPADETIRGEATSSLAQMSLVLAREQSLPMRLFGESALGAQAAMLDRWRELVVATRGGSAELRSWAEDQRRSIERPGNIAEIITAMLVPNLVDAALKLQLGSSSRRLALVALSLRLEGLRSGSYPSLASLPEPLRAPTPYLEEIVVVRETLDGGLEVALPESAADWDATHPEHVLRPRLLWTLPPIEAPTRSAGSMEGWPIDAKVAIAGWAG